jgi:hypothetical protein
MATPYLNGYSVKPASVDGLGIVSFTDGTIAVTPNQQQCEAYGYTYDRASGTCKAFTYSTSLGKSLNNESNYVRGANNTTETGTNNTHIMGESNTVKGISRNNIIVGSNNEIANGVNNAVVFGNYGLAQRPGEVVFGGGGFSGAGKGYAQSSYITLTGTTTDATPTSLYVNGDSATTIIARNGNVFTSLVANTVGVRTGGSNVLGAVNDRIFLKTTGIAYADLVNQSSTTIASFGTVGALDANIEVIQYVTDGSPASPTNFATVNASSSQLNVAAPLVQNAINAVSPMTANTWYRFSDNTGYVAETSGVISFTLTTGIMQTLSNLSPGVSYNLTVNFVTTSGTLNFYQYKGNTLVSGPTTITGLGAQTISFTANTSSDTIVLEAASAIIFVESISVATTAGGGEMLFKVTGDIDMDISWSCTLNLYEVII